jgi:hypothetical protein
LPFVEGSDKASNSGGLPIWPREWRIARAIDAFERLQSTKYEKKSVIADASKIDFGFVKKPGESKEEDILNTEGYSGPTHGTTAWGRLPWSLFYYVEPCLSQLRPTFCRAEPLAEGDWVWATEETDEVKIYLSKLAEVTSWQPALPNISHLQSRPDLCSLDRNGASHPHAWQ